MVVLAITGVLATIGTWLVRQHFQSAKMTEGMAVVQAIRVAEEAIRTETGVYLNCSTSSTGWYPAKPNNRTRSWLATGHADYARWKQLDIDRPDGTQFGFLVNAGLPGAALPALASTEQATWPTAPTEPWYVIQGIADRDGDGVYAYIGAASFNGEVYVDNELE